MRRLELRLQAILPTIQMRLKKYGRRIRYLGEEIFPDIKEALQVRIPVYGAGTLKNTGRW